MWPACLALRVLMQAFGYVCAPNTYISRKDEGDKVIVFERGDLVFVFNFHPTQSFQDYRVGCREPGPYKVRQKVIPWGRVKKAKWKVARPAFSDSRVGSVEMLTARCYVGPRWRHLPRVMLTHGIRCDDQPRGALIQCMVFRQML
jgi:hypothetical protein